MLSSEQVEKLTVCSVCLDKFTNPRLLPCGHTFCLACLVGINRTGGQKISCPHCREEHKLPPGGIEGFKPNFALNELVVGLSAATAQTVPKCSECQQNDSVAKCDHCNTKLCVPCITEHTALTTEIKTVLSIMKPLFTEQASVNEIRQKGRAWETVLSDIVLEKAKVEKNFQQRIKELEQRKNALLTYFDTIQNTILLFRDVKSTGSGTEIFTRLNADISIHKTADGLKRYLETCRLYMTSVDTLKGMQDAERFNFQTENEAEFTKELLSYGKVCLGDKKMIITSDGNECIDDGAENEPRISLAPHSEDDSAAVSQDMRTTQPAPSAAPPLAEASQRWEPSIHTPTASASGISPQASHQPPASPSTSAAGVENPPPPQSIIDYKAKIRGWKQVINEFNAPSGVAYSHDQNEILVADHDCITVLDSELDISKRIDFGCSDLLDVSLCDDPNEFVFSIDGEVKCADFHGDIRWSTNYADGANREFQGFCLLACSEYHVYVANGNCITVLNYDGDYLRHFGGRYLNSARFLTVGPDDKIYVTDVTDQGEGLVKVFNFNGSFHRSFGARSGTRATGIAVDCEGFVSVSRSDVHIIDVYNPDGILHCSLGRRRGKHSDQVLFKSGDFPGSLSKPRGLCLLPDGGLLVADTGNNRVQIF